VTTTAVDARSAGEAAAVPREAGAAAVPCLSKNNCNGYSVKPCGKDRKKGEAVRQNLDLFVKQKGASSALFTITFAEEGITTKEAQRRFHSFCAGVLLEHFGDRIAVREFTQRGRPHFHLLIDCLGDVTTGFNWEYHDAVTLWSKHGRKGAKPRGNLRRTERLATLHALLNEKGPKYGLGRMELVPVRKPDAVAFYLGGYLSKSLANKPADAKGTRAVNYSHKCPRSHKGDFSWANPSGWLWRAKLAQWCMKRGWSAEHFAVMRGEFSKFIYGQKEAILAEQLSYWPTIEHARRDGAFPSWDLERLGPDAVEIRRVRMGDSDDPFWTCGITPHELATVFAQSEAFRRLWDSHCDSSKPPGGDRKAPPEAMFPPEEGFGETWFPIETASDGVRKRMDGGTVREYWLDSGEDTTEKARRILYGHNPF